MTRSSMSVGRAAVALLCIVAGACSGGSGRSSGTSDTRAHGRPTTSGATVSPRSTVRSRADGAPSLLRSGSDPSVLPGPLLIADRDNNRLVEVNPRGQVIWQFPRPGDLAPGQTFTVPDDAFFTPDGSQIIATEEDAFVISLIDVAQHRIVWRYGTPGKAGRGPGQLNNPDDAMVLPDGSVLAADIKNCRIIVIPRGGQAPSTTLGQVGRCRHRPPTSYASPNGAFPMQNGHYLVTEIRGAWVDEVDLTGKVYWSAHLPGVAYPSDSNEQAPGQYVTVDYSRPGQILRFDQTGAVLWRYAPAGEDALDHPSLAEPLPDGKIIANDDANDRVIVVDPATNRIVWQLGAKNEPGDGPGHLHHPDGLDLAPPNNLLGRHAATMGNPPPAP
jgi:outer membrane protein assembly factor BamB